MCLGHPNPIRSQSTQCFTKPYASATMTITSVRRNNVNAVSGHWQTTKWLVWHGHEGCSISVVHISYAFAQMEELRAASAHGFARFFTNRGSRCVAQRTFSLTSMVYFRYGSLHSKWCLHFQLSLHIICFTCVLFAPAKSTPKISQAHCGGKFHTNFIVYCFLFLFMIWFIILINPYASLCLM